MLTLASVFLHVSVSLLVKKRQVDDVLIVQLQTLID